MNRAERSTRARDEHISPLRLSTYVDGETPREERAEIEAHLSACHACASRLDALRSVSAMLAALPRTTPSAGVLDKVLAGARSVDNASNAVSRERLGRSRGSGPVRLREVRLPDMDAPSSTPPTRRRSRWRAPFIGALPTIAALLLITLTAGLLLRSSLVTTELPIVTPTATLPPGDALKATNSALIRLNAPLEFTPITPAYLPDGARFGAVTTNLLAPGLYRLDITWTFSDGPLRALHLREQLVNAPTNNRYASPATQTANLEWRVSQYPWRAMTRIERPGWVGVEQTRGPVHLMLDAQPAPGASPTEVAAKLRLTSLSLDAPYAPPPVAIGAPLPGSMQRSIASVTGTDGQMWTWDVTLSADQLSRYAKITTSSGDTSVTEITYVGAGVRLDNVHKIYQTIPGPTPYNSPPSGVTQIAYDASSFLGTGQLWNLGPKTITLPDGPPIKVYDLYRVDTAQPEHVYTDATTGAVVAISVDTSSSGSPGGGQPYVSRRDCPPYTVTYSWIIFEPASQSSSLFNRAPSPDYKPGSVSLPFTCGG